MAHDAAHGQLGIQPRKVIAAEVGVVDVVGRYVRHRDHDRVLDGDNGFLLTQPRSKPVISCAEVGGVLGAGGGHRGDAQPTTSERLERSQHRPPGDSEDVGGQKTSASAGDPTQFSRLRRVSETELGANVN